jgi:PDZ domain
VKLRRLHAAALASAAWAACASALLIEAAGAKDPPLLSLSLEHFRDTATIKDDLPSATATISTEPGFVEHSGPLHMVWQDQYLTTLIDHKTGQKSFLVHQVITYSGNLRVYETAQYQSEGGPRTVPAALVRKEAVNCLVGDCTYTEEIAFAVDEATLRRLAATYVPGRAVLWPYKLSVKSAAALNAGLSTAEIAGLLVKVDEYTGAPATVAAGAPIAASNRIAFGVEGIPVAATAEQPNRAGVLITAVDRGSVAQKSGVIVGDILYEFDGHPIGALAQLHAAVAACAANAAVAVKLYRGMDPVLVTARF